MARAPGAGTEPDPQPAQAQEHQGVDGDRAPGLPTCSRRWTSSRSRRRSKRFWIIKLVERREDPSLTFEQVRGPLLTALKRDAVEELRARLDADLRSDAAIDYE